MGRVGATDQETDYALGAVDEMLAEIAGRRGEREWSGQVATLRALREEIVSDIIDGFEEAERRLDGYSAEVAQNGD